MAFVEVKTRFSENVGRSLVAENRRKHRLIIRGVMTRLPILDMQDITFRFDVFKLDMEGPSDIRHIENSFVLPRRYVY
jgi:Holliday junction resolvase-like predicted endonuclease